MFRLNPLRKLDAHLQARLNRVELADDKHESVSVILECRKGSEEAVAGFVRHEGGEVLDIIASFHLVAAELPIDRIERVARRFSVREINLSVPYIIA
jgi:hypothetical protein